MTLLRLFGRRLQENISACLRYLVHVENWSSGFLRVFRGPRWHTVFTVCRRGPRERGLCTGARPPDSHTVCSCITTFADMRTSSCCQSLLFGVHLFGLLPGLGSLTRLVIPGLLMFVASARLVMNICTERPWLVVSVLLLRFVVVISLRLGEFSLY